LGTNYGVGYSKNLTTWYDGPTAAGCNSSQQELSMIASSTNGVSFRADDFTETFNSATTTSFSNNQFTQAGTITTDTKKICSNSV
jgi:hypothetical protein